MPLSWVYLLVIVTIFASGCSQQVVVPEQETPPPVTELEKPVQPVKKEKRPAPPPPPPPQIIILVSEAIPAYERVAQELEKRLPEGAKTAYLNRYRKVGKEITEQLARPDYQQIVAIGLYAATEARRVAGDEDDVIFCQVFNYRDHQLIGVHSKGVGAIAGTKSMFANWSRLSPTLNNIGIVTGSGMEAVVTKAASEASTYGIRLQHKVVANDKELLFEFKRMAPHIQGIWLLPDNRVLSRQAIKELLSFSVRSGKQVAVFNDELLRIGGLMSVTPRVEEIADRVVERLQAAHNTEGVPGPQLLLLEDGDIRINRAAARRYGIAK